MEPAARNKGSRRAARILFLINLLPCLVAVYFAAILIYMIIPTLGICTGLLAQFGYYRLGYKNISQAETERWWIYSLLLNTALLFLGTIGSTMDDWHRFGLRQTITVSLLGLYQLGFLLTSFRSFIKSV